MRVLAIAVLVLLLAPALRAAEGMTVVIDGAEIQAEAGGSEVRRLVTVQADCPVSGTANLTVSAIPELGIRLYPEEITWQRCSSQARSQVFAAMFVRPAASLTGGLYEGTLTVTAKDGQTASAKFSVRIPYSATVGFQGPKVTQIRAGAEVTQPFNVTVLANGPTRVELVVAAPDGWTAQAPTTLTTSRLGAVQRLPWSVRIDVPEGATGDGRFVFTATASSSDGKDTADPVTYEWFARIPVQREQVLDPQDVRPPEADEGTPAWLLGLGLIAVASVAFWWARR